MFKKILFISLVVLFSTTVISKEKVFLDYGFLKDISTRTDKACELNANGKTVKADKLLKEISQELTNYLSKLGTFSLSKESITIQVSIKIIYIYYLPLFSIL